MCLQLRGRQSAYNTGHRLLIFKFCLVHGDFSLSYNSTTDDFIYLPLICVSGSVAVCKENITSQKGENAKDQNKI